MNTVTFKTGHEKNLHFGYATVQLCTDGTAAQLCTDAAAAQLISAFVFAR